MEDIFINIQHSKSKTKLKFDQNLSNYYDEMTYRRQSNDFQFEEDPFIKIADGISKSYHEVLMLMKFLQTKPEVKGTKINYFDL